MRKKLILTITAIMLFLTATSINVTALSDPANDIWHQLIDENEPETVSWQAYGGSKDYLDITNLSYTTTETEVIFTMTVNGTIQNNKTIQYVIFVTLSDPNPYNPIADNVVWNAHYVNGTEIITDADISNNGDTTNDVGTNTWTVVFDVENPDNVTDFYGFAAEYDSTTKLKSGEYWIDYVPDTAHPFYTILPDDTNQDTSKDNDTDDNTTDDSTNETTGNENINTPGFEFAILIGAVASIFFIVRKKK